MTDRDRIDALERRVAELERALRILSSHGGSVSSQAATSEPVYGPPPGGYPRRPLTTPGVTLLGVDPKAHARVIRALRKAEDDD